MTILAETFPCRPRVLAMPAVRLLALSLLAFPVPAADWPTSMADYVRSGTTVEQPVLPLQLQWAHRPARPPRPAWPEPARQDYYNRRPDLQNVQAFDQAFEVVAVGTDVVFGSSSEDKVCCLDRGTGLVRWTVFTEGPVRCAPVVAGGRVYFGADDGVVTCVAAETGRTVWRYRVGAEDVRLPGNGRIISLWPVRTGLMVQDGLVYGAAGLFPAQGVFVFALDAATGTLRWRERSSQPLQGNLLLSGQRLFAPAGRMAPLAFDLASGKQVDDFDGGRQRGGGTGAQLADRQLVYANEAGTMIIKDAERSAGIPLGLNARRMVRIGDTACFLAPDELYALDWRKVVAARSAATEKALPGAAAVRKGSERWTRHDTFRGGLIAAGDLLFTGNPGQVVAIGVADGATRWTAAVDGLPCAFAVAHGALFVSTDTGVIHCFTAAGGQNRPGGIPPAAHPAAPGGAIDPELDTTVVGVPGTAPWPAEAAGEACATAAAAALNQSGSGRGYGVIVGDDGRLAYAIAARTDLDLIIVEEDAARVAEARDRLSRVDLLGIRIGVIQGTLATVRLRRYCANLIVAGSTLRGGALPAAAEVARLLRPEGGIALIGRAADAMGDLREPALRSWLLETGLEGGGIATGSGLWGVIRRGALPGAGEWTHCFGDAGNTACSGDRLVAGPMDIQWFGRPGPRYMIDRHHRNVPPLYKRGRLFIPGDDIIFAVDAYNGAMLWHAAIPGSRRLGAFLDCGSMAVDEERLYVAQGDHCLGFEVATGRPSVRLPMPRMEAASPHAWGYLALEKEWLLGSGRRSDAAYTETSRVADEALWNDAMSLVTSDYLFGMDRRGDRPAWQYRGGRIINTTLAASGGRLHFVETAAGPASSPGRLPLTQLFADGQQSLVGLDAATGTVLYRRPLDTSHFGMLIYLNTTADVLLVSGSKNVDQRVWYFFQAFNAADGTPLWERSHATGFKPGGEHGEQNRHPTIVGDIVYAWPLAYRLRTGEPVPGWTFERLGHGCGDVSASAAALFWRGGNPWSRDLAPGSKAMRLDNVTRPGCFINIIPAGGLVLIPEASSGCTCPLPMQMSLAHIPVERP